MDEAIEALDGTHFELAERVRKVESRIAPPGGAAAPYYTPPSEDFSRPGRTWLPTMGADPLPRVRPGLDLVPRGRARPSSPARAVGARRRRASPATRRPSAWSAPTPRAGRCTRSGSWTSWASSRTPEQRLGYLDAQMMRAARVIVDIGMHLELEIPADSPFHPGERWTPELAQEFFGAHSGRPADFVESELTRYLTHAGPGHRLQARRARLAARAARTRARRTATPSTSRPGTWRRCRRARWAWTTWWTSCRGSDGAAGAYGRPGSSVSPPTPWVKRRG